MAVLWGHLWLLSRGGGTWAGASRALNLLNIELWLYNWASSGWHFNTNATWGLWARRTIQSTYQGLQKWRKKQRFLWKAGNGDLELGVQWSHLHVANVTTWITRVGEGDGPNDALSLAPRPLYCVINRGLVFLSVSPALSHLISMNVTRGRAGAVWICFHWCPCHMEASVSTALTENKGHVPTCSLPNEQSSCSQLRTLWLTSALINSTQSSASCVQIWSHLSHFTF
jgi:hypothetical protein